MVISGRLQTLSKLWLAPELEALADRIAREARLDGDSRVAVMALNPALHVAALLAGAKTGAVIAPIGSRSNFKNVESLSACLANLDADVLVTDFEDLAFARPGEISVLQFHCESAELAAKRLRPRRADHPANWKGARLLLYTSGSTGAPKGVVIGADALDFIVRSNIRTSQFDRDSVFLHCLPNSHMAGVANILAALAGGASVVESPSMMWVGAVLKKIHELKVTTVGLVPFYLSKFLMNDIFKTLESLRLVLLSAAPIIGPDVERAAHLLPKVEFKNAYGLTEAFRSTVLESGNVLEKLPSVGLPAEGVEVELRDENGHPAPRGRIFIKGPNLMMGYWDNASATAEALEGGWLRTEDFAHRDKSGFIFIDGRSSEIINGGGEKISVQELERCIEKEFGVCCVVAATAGRMGTVDIAVVIESCHEGKVSLDGIRAHCAKFFHTVFLPKRIKFTEKIARTETGKISRKEIERWIQQEDGKI